MRTLITGATSGIGESLAIEYSNQGHTVYACGRNQEKLSMLEDEHGIHGLAFDVTELSAIHNACAELEPLDTVILNAGNCEYIDNPSTFDSALFERVLKANTLSIGYCLEALLPKLKKGGRLVLVSSSASFVPLPRAEAYGASKAAVSYLGRTLQATLKEYQVTLVHPGFVKTPLTDKNDFDMPFLISSENAAKRMYKGIETGKSELHFPKRFTFFLKLFGLLPQGLWAPLAKRIKQ